MSDKPVKIEKVDGEEMGFFDHLQALMPHLVRSFAALFVFLIVAFLLKGFIIDTVLFGPQSADFPTNRLLNYLGERWNIEGLKVNDYVFQLINTSVAGQINLHLRVSFSAALVFTVPYLLWELWRFVKPALTVKERRGTRFFVLWVSLCFFVGLLFGYYVITPLSLNFLLNYTVSDQIKNMVDIGSYLNNVLGISIACGVVFELPLLMFFLGKIGIITPAFLRRYRRHAIVIIAIFSAIITPPDVLSLVLVFIPFYGLYELSIKLLSKTTKEKGAKSVEAKEI